MARLTERGRRTRERILRAAAAQFSTRGFARTSVDDVLEASGTGKSQFYHYFENKADLVRTVLREQRKESLPGQHPLDDWAGIREWLDEIASAAAERGAVGLDRLGAVSMELGEADGPLRREIVRTTHLRRRLLYRGLRRMERRGALKQEADPARLATFVAATIEGGLLLASTEGSATPLRDALEECWAHLSRYAAEVQK